jgi:hypothetical protein
VYDDDENERAEEDDWGNPPSPDTPENRKKSQRAQLIIGIVTMIGIFLPGILFWLIKG